MPGAETALRRVRRLAQADRDTGEAHPGGYPPGRLAVGTDPIDIVGHNFMVPPSVNRPGTVVIMGGMAVDSGVEVWRSPAWRRRAVSWLDSCLATAGAARTGAVEQPHLRPWATALRAPTTRGPVWLKAAGPGTAYEVRLYELLASVVPDQVLAPLAIDVRQGWIVLPDGGPTLGDRLSGKDLVDALVEIVPRYGRLQRALAPYADDIVALGAPDMRPAVLPARFDEALDAVARYVSRRGTPAERDRYQRIAALRPAVVAWCARLDGPTSLDHNDLHPWNIFPADGDGGTGAARFYDWGDSVVAHPFASMLVTLRVLRQLLGVRDDDPSLLRVRDAYLAAFADLAPPAVLVATMEVACRVGMVARALSWHRVVRQLPDEEAGEFAGAPLDWLASLLDDSYLGEDR